MYNSVSPDAFAHKAVKVYLVHKTDIDYQCPICYELFTEPLSEPFITDCGHICCRKCRDRLLDSSKTECPTCRGPNMLNNARCDKYLQRKVKCFKVRCSDYQDGCEWVGELRDLYSHLDPVKGLCVVACPFECGRYARRSEMREHTRQCNKRMISCENCGYYNTFTIVTDKHYPICPQSFTDCPNQHCPVKLLRRHELKQHLNECSHQLVDCPSTGCLIQLPLEEMMLHTLQQHNLDLEEAKQAAAITTASPQYLYNQAPMEFIISDYHKKKEANEEWISSPFYTHNRGYKFCLSVYPNGNLEGRDSHLSVYAQLMKGEYDDDLEWPFEKDISIELLNWREDENDYSDTISFNRHNDPDGKYCSRVTDQETAPGYGNSQFISHIDLVSTTNTKYLRDDYLKLRVTALVYSTPLLHLTPGWQDSRTQSRAQFTISEYSKRKQFNNYYYSPPFTTSPQGYTLSIAVCANGYDSGEGSHLSIFAMIMKGEHDDCLQWPFTGTIIVELLNWLEDKGHYRMTLTIDTDVVEVTKREYGIIASYPQFIAQSSLNSSTDTQYLYQDCICVRVQAIANN